jgi:hypothetical protein|tara:strand:- start:4229 stop:4912 length:684 start_codon:yes stop_codon:yes gene_type:complete
MPPKRRAKKLLPLSGSEKRYTHRFWGSRRGVGNNNCYAYAFGDYEGYRGAKSTPGDRAKTRRYGSLKCRDLAKGVLADNKKKVYKAKPTARCKPGYFKAMMVVAPGRDFHFYRQHGEIELKIKRGDTAASIARFLKIPLGRVRMAIGKHKGRDPKTGKLRVGKNIRIKCNGWSHKRGWATGPLLHDAKGKVIKDPRRASRNYPGLNYSKFCGAFCVKDRGIRTGYDW